MNLFDLEKRDAPFDSYEAYTNHLFACVDLRLSGYIDRLMHLFANENGGFKNVLYPDIEIARDLCEQHVTEFRSKQSPAPVSAEENNFEEY